MLLAVGSAAVGRVDGDKMTRRMKVYCMHLPPAMLPPLLSVRNLFMESSFCCLSHELHHESCVGGARLLQTQVQMLTRQILLCR